MTATSDRSAARRADADLAPEDLLARPKLWKRLAIAVLVVIVAMPVVPPIQIAVWLALYTFVAAAEPLAARLPGRAGRASGIWATFALSVLNALAAIVLIQHGDG